MECMGESSILDSSFLLMLLMKITRKHIKIMLKFSIQKEYMKSKKFLVIKSPENQTCPNNIKLMKEMIDKISFVEGAELFLLTSGDSF